MMDKMHRRKFLKAGMLASAGLVSRSIFGESTLSVASPKRLVVLHTNDMHSRIEPFPDDGSKFANLGGMARRATLVRQIQQQEPHVLLLDAGDIFQGTPYFNYFGGELEFKLMSKMGYDAATLGNHDFDNGIDGLMEQLPEAKFSFVSSNYDFSKTPLKNHILPYRTIRKGGIKVGLFGLGIELEGLVPRASFGATKYLDPVGVAMEMVSLLKGKKCDLIICLSHLGFSFKSQKIDDKKLAAQVEGIDLIIGGHTHTFLDHPVEILGPNGHTTMINQVGWSGLLLGRVDFELGLSKKRKIMGMNSTIIK